MGKKIFRSVTQNLGSLLEVGLGLSKIVGGVYLGAVLSESCDNSILTASLVGAGLYLFITGCKDYVDGVERIFEDKGLYGEKESHSFDSFEVAGYRQFRGLVKRGIRR